MFNYCFRCLTRDDTRRRTETVEAASRTVTETKTAGTTTLIVTGTERETEKGTEDEDTDTEDHQHSHPAVTENVTERGGDTDRKEAMYDRGGVSLNRRFLFDAVTCF